MRETHSDRLKTVGTSEGRAYWFLGTLIVIKSTGEDSGGAYTLMEQVAPPGFSPPLHMHHVEDEAYYVLEGQVRFKVGNREFDVGAGGYAFLPSKVPHTFRVEGSQPARILIWSLPSGFDGLIRSIGVEAPAHELPPSGPLKPDLLERLAGLGSKYQFSILGPPLDSR